jgi:hypothetical protein
MDSFLKPTIKRDIFIALIVLMMSEKRTFILTQLNTDMVNLVINIIKYVCFVTVIALPISTIAYFAIGLVVYAYVIRRYGERGELHMRLYLNSYIGQVMGYLCFTVACFCLAKYFNTSAVSDTYIIVWGIMMLIFELHSVTGIGGLFSIVTPDGVIDIVEIADESSQITFIKSKTPGPFVLNWGFFLAIQRLERMGWNTIIIERENNIHSAKMKRIGAKTL